MPSRIVHIPQALYSHPSKKSQTRYSRPLDGGFITFCRSGMEEEGIILKDALDGFKSCIAGLNGARDFVLQKHATNVTLHVLASTFLSCASIPPVLTTAFVVCLPCSPICLVARSQAVEDLDLHEVLIREDARADNSGDSRQKTCESHNQVYSGRHHGVHCCEPF